ncbi:Anaerobic glycerol-3-phosphate dehydrogenase subunit A [Serratia fonticola]|uniref:Anaerobic glycerol-3-phosphate dehydrogenase subunit A n=1 Tax=Serratia fonticola TaxID=47917 RepID=A0A4V6KNC6_SERFO|nr:Anaerobic glycerol-3-phosphate dehydrogenase subunit A [Serratia fonticola]
MPPGLWGQQIAEYADLRIRMFPAKGALLILGHRINNMVINRCRKPADADILVPGDTISLIGTTSTHIDYDQIDNMVVDATGSGYINPRRHAVGPETGANAHSACLCGRAATGRQRRRPFWARTSAAASCCSTMRHAMGWRAFITITGGKLDDLTGWMAEWATDLVCAKLGIDSPCTTAEAALARFRQSAEETVRSVVSLPASIRGSAGVSPRRSRQPGPFWQPAGQQPGVCECEAVTAGEVRYAVDSLTVNNLVDLRRRTRVGMGTCQGELCACRAAGLLTRFNVGWTPQQSHHPTVPFPQ